MSRLEELRLAAEAATPGEWEPYFNTHGDPFVVPSTTPYLTSRLCDVSIAEQLWPEKTPEPKEGRPA